jgi:hypothetical protein
MVGGFMIVIRSTDMKMKHHTLSREDDVVLRMMSTERAPVFFFFVVVGDALASMRWIWGPAWHFPGNDYVL